MFFTERRILLLPTWPSVGASASNGAVLPSSGEPVDAPEGAALGAASPAEPCVLSALFVGDVAEDGVRRRNMGLRFERIELSTQPCEYLDCLDERALELTGDELVRVCAASGSNGPWLTAREIALSTWMC